MNLQPLADRVLVKRSAPPADSIIVNVKDAPPDQGIVVAVGAGTRLKGGGVAPVSVSVGDRIMFGKYGGEVIKSPDGDLLCIRDGDIIGVLED